MHHGMFSCDPRASMREVAAIMVSHRVHALVVPDSQGRPSEVISDSDVIAAVAAAEDLLAEDVAGSEALSVSGDSSLREASRLMAEHAVAHVIVRDGSSGQPIGVLSTTDVLSVYAVGTDP